MGLFLSSFFISFLQYPSFVLIFYSRILFYFLLFFFLRAIFIICTFFFTSNFVHVTIQLITLTAQIFGFVFFKMFYSSFLMLSNSQYFLILRVFFCFFVFLHFLIFSFAEHFMISKLYLFSLLFHFFYSLLPFDVSIPFLLIIIILIFIYLFPILLFFLFISLFISSQFSYSSVYFYFRFCSFTPIFYSYCKLAIYSKLIQQLLHIEHENGCNKNLTLTHKLN